MKLKNPLNDVFNIDDEINEDLEEAYAMTQAPVQAEVQGPPVDHKDDDDKLIEGRIDAVYDAAMLAYESQQGMVEIIEPRYAARTAEVAANYLNIALQAANSRAKVKNDRKRANGSFVPYANGGGRTTNNILVADRSEIMRMINLDGQPKEIK